jgi:hypothetical protein
MTITGRRRRDSLRAGHLAAAALAGAYIYTPAADVEAFAWGVRLIALPGLTITGVRMWKPRLGRRRSAARMASSDSA